jgi:phage terminase large subunit
MSNDFNYKPTTAFWKIHRLIKNGLSQFKSDDKKVFVIQGGQGAGKTISILMLLIDYFERSKVEITICSAELSKLKDTALNDFLKILQDWKLYEQKYFNKTESLYQKDAGHFIEFIGLDKADVGKGRRRKLVYINEANKVTLEQYADITARADIVIIDFNPNRRFWGHDLINDFNFINLTYKDNEFLSQNEISNILNYYKLGYHPETGQTINEYWANMWRVYGLGEVGQVEGRIYNWKPINYFEYLQIDKQPIIGVDWGTVDPFAIVEIKYHDGNLYLHELNYKSENEIRRELSQIDQHTINAKEDEGLVTWLFQKLNIDKRKIIVCDNNRPNKIIALRRSGWENAVAVGGKSKLLDRINTLQGLNIYYTHTSKNIELEQESYSYQKDKFGVIQEEPIDSDNHLIDATAYGVAKLFEMGIIKNV